MAGTRGITITPYFQRDFVPGSHDGFRIRIEAADGVDMPDEVFAYRALPLQPGQDEPVGFFDHICSSVDLAEFPAAAPLVNATPPWFRLAYIDLVLPSRAAALELVEDVRHEIRALVFSMDAEDTLVARPAERVGAAAPDPEESSSSSLG